MFIRKKTHNRIVAELEATIHSLEQQLNQQPAEPTKPAPVRKITLTFEDGKTVTHKGVTYEIKSDDNADGGITIRDIDPFGYERTVAWYAKIPVSIISVWE